MQILLNSHAPGFVSAFPIRIRIQDSQMNADPVPDPQHWSPVKGFIIRMELVTPMECLFRNIIFCASDPD